MKRKVFRALIFTLFQLCILLINFQVLLAQAEIGIGNWRTHFSYQDARILSLTNQEVYVATQNGLFTYDLQDNNLSVLSKTDGLSDVGISAMAYQEELDMLAIAYRSGIVDFLIGNTISSFTLLADSESNESIHAIVFSGSTVYLATSLGVRLLDVPPESGSDISIRESYTRLAEDGETLAIYDAALTTDSIFLASDEGVIANALASNINRQDFASWRRFGPAEELTTEPVFFLEQKVGLVYAAVNGEGVRKYDGKSWQLTDLQTSESFSSLRVSGQRLLASAGNKVWISGEKSQVLELPNPKDVALDANGILWVADGSTGLIKIMGDVQESFYPSGPLSDDLYSIHFAGDRLISLQEGKPAFSTFQEGRWSNFNESLLKSVIQHDDLSPLVDADYLATDASFYFASTSSGLLRWNGEDQFTLITAGDEGNSLENNRISALLASENFLWVTNYDATEALHRYSAVDESWQAFAPNRTEARFPLQLTIFNEIPWIISGQGGIDSKSGNHLLVFDPEANSTLLVRSVVATGSLPGSIFTKLAEDRRGQGWLGGNEGISYFPAPFDMFNAPVPALIKPVFENQFLLFGDYVTTLAVDGGDRKWVGTRDGIWLFGENGETLISRFTAGNSPLPSDNILDITLNDDNGEVFILTDQGLVSYRGTASEGQAGHQSVKIFPNPVSPDFDGLVGIEGLVTDAIVKITTISGTLVRQLEAAGGTAAWDTQDYNGSRVATGIYLVFSASADGSETFVGKIAVIN